MNAMDYAKERKKKAERKENILLCMIVVGVMLILVGAMGLMNKFHPVTLSMVFIGAMIIEAAMLTGRKK